MKMIKTALLATAAIAAVSTVARADELSDLKAQIEALNARISQVETAPSVPAGYQLVSISKGKVHQFGLDSDEDVQGTVISVLPAADAPASTEVVVSGFVRAALVWQNSTAWSSETFGVQSRGQVKISGKTDTAVGEVSAFMVLRANQGLDKAPGSVSSPEYWGSWNFAEGMTLAAGYTGSLSGIGYGYDGKCNCYYTDNASAGYGHGDAGQVRLSYASGPISFAVALEDDGTNTTVHGDKALGVAGELKYSGDVISGEISGGWWNNDAATGSSSAHSIAAGLGFAVADGINLSMSAGMVNGHGASSDKAWKVNGLASVALSDTISAELGANYFKHKVKGKETSVLAGIYFNPVSQLTIGLEGETISADKAALQKVAGKKRRNQLDLVMVYRF